MRGLRGHGREVHRRRRDGGVRRAGRARGRRRSERSGPGCGSSSAIEDLNAVERGLELAVRIGINTGEAVVTLGRSTVSKGEGFVTGDVVNTAARLQTGAPVGGDRGRRAATYAVDARTCSTTRRWTRSSGKGEVRSRSRAWRATGSRARFGTDRHPARTDRALVGREAERALLRDRARHVRSGDRVVPAGHDHRANRVSGKSRMVYELGSRSSRLVPELMRLASGALPARTARGSRSGPSARS